MAAGRHWEATPRTVEVEVRVVVVVVVAVMVEAGAVTVLVLLTVVVAGVMERQEQAAETLLEAYADRYGGMLFPARFPFGGGVVAIGRPKVEVTVVVVETVTVLVVVTGAGVFVTFEILVVVLKGIEMKELQNLVAEALMAGLWRMLRTSETTAQFDKPLASRMSLLSTTGLEETRGAIDPKSAQRRM